MPLGHRGHSCFGGRKVRVGARVTNLGEDFVELGDEAISTRTVLWAAGVRANPLAAHLGVPLDKAGRVWVEDDLSTPDRREVFVVGDSIAKTQNGKPLPGVAQLAVQSGRHAAKNIRLSIDGLPRLPFRYVDKGSMATIGRNRAVAQIGRFKSSGIVAWWLWLTVHLLSLVGFRSRIAVLDGVGAVLLHLAATVPGDPRGAQRAGDQRGALHRRPGHPPRRGAKRGFRNLARRILAPSSAYSLRRGPEASEGL